MHDILIESLPDIVLLLRRDGTVVAAGGGEGVGALRPPPEAAGRSLEAFWPQPVAELLKQLGRKAIAARMPVEARFREGGYDYEARVSARGPDLTVCMIRTLLAQDDGLEGSRGQGQWLDRRAFLKHLKDAVALAALREQQLCVALIHIDGISDIGQIARPEVAERVMSAAIGRLPPPGTAHPRQLGQLGESLLAMALETGDRDVIEAEVSAVCASLRRPIALGGAQFQLAPHAGIAVLGQDAPSPRILLDQARSAATEARRSGSERPNFFTDTLRMRALSRLDIARELREAIEHRSIRLRYAGRHELATGRLAAWAGYLRWQQPLRGEVRPAELLRVAEATGMALPLSRMLLTCLREDFAAHGASWDPQVRISFGPLRHHVLHEDFAGDISRFVREGAVPAERLELRIAEKTFIGLAPAQCECIHGLGVRLVIDEVGRELASLDRLARAPIWGLQLDRAWVTVFRNDAAALKVCRAGIAVAAALGLAPLATGVDDREQCEALLALGCLQGSGDFYRTQLP
ncbi:MAG TPA: EAL domain-containing protein [Steroidobacteraceae bacterium]|nr:EAL domain-containing protein [Steroidobacteraceae bacterium]